MTMKRRPAARQRPDAKLQVCLLLVVLFLVVFVVGFVRWVAPSSSSSSASQPTPLRSALHSEVWLPAGTRQKPGYHAVGGASVHKRLQSESTAAFSSLHLLQHKQVSHDTYYLGKHAHPHHGYEMEGYAFLHMHEKAARTPGPNLTKKVHFNRSEQHIVGCAAPIAEATYWKRSRGYWIHAQNRHAMSDEFVREAYAAAADRWQCALDSVAVVPAGPFLGFVDGAMDTSVPTGRNEMAFGSIHGRPGTVAVTISWGVFGGPLATRHLSEYKLLFDEQQYQWGDGARKRSVMDLQAVATHELGHSLGLDDIYTSACTHVTMFGSSSEGATEKRTLEDEDVAGIQRLYKGVS